LPECRIHLAKAERTEGWDFGDVLDRFSSRQVVFGNITKFVRVGQDRIEI
jgi:hypothetical protein